MYIKNPGVRMILTPGFIVFLLSIFRIFQKVHLKVCTLLYLNLRLRIEVFVKLVQNLKI